MLTNLIRFKLMPTLVITGCLLLVFLLQFSGPNEIRQNDEFAVAVVDFSKRFMDEKTLNELRLSYDVFLVKDEGSDSEQADDAMDSERSPLLTLEQQVGEVGMLQLPEGIAVLKAIIRDEKQQYAVLMMKHDEEKSADVKVADQGEFYGLTMAIRNSTSVSFSNSDLEADIILRLYE